MEWFETAIQPDIGHGLESIANLRLELSKSEQATLAPRLSTLSPRGPNSTRDLVTGPRIVIVCI